MLEKFNERFNTLSDDQKDVLKEYINNITNTTNLKKYVDTKFTYLKESLLKLLPKIEDATIKIKVNETINLINPILESKVVKDDNIVALLQYQELHSELTKIHKLDPRAAQTGPAVRNDLRVLQMHEDLISNPEHLKIYNTMNESIKKMYEL
jgi:hypothetical protein